MFKNWRQVIVSVEFLRRGASWPMIQWAARAGQALLASYWLCSLIVTDLAVGEVTDGCHPLGFGHNLGSS